VAVPEPPLGLRMSGTVRRQRRQGDGSEGGAIEPPDPPAEDGGVVPRLESPWRCLLGRRRAVTEATAWVCWDAQLLSGLDAERGLQRLAWASSYMSSHSSERCC
jgi:hypothetical protein